ncbi:hypothetical protein BVC80_1719g36 [Macleaya cordata]|uniref:Uncharacterized protein n=1 Tax=Macleaya cordata TaxID=56857 RepID=A0A200Q2M4_MACCD|nr:hypothetical protein BVC80_1719g36 [Macleaya cordata]
MGAIREEWLLFDKWSLLQGDLLHLCIILREDGEIKLYFNFIIPVEHLGAYKQWSLWSTTHIEDCSLGLLHSFGFALIVFLSNSVDESEK